MEEKLHQIKLDGMRAEVSDLTPMKQPANEAADGKFEKVFREKTSYRTEPGKKKKGNKSDDSTGNVKDTSPNTGTHNTEKAAQAPLDLEKRSNKTKSESKSKSKSKDLEGLKLKTGRTKKAKSLKKNIKEKSASLGKKVAAETGASSISGAAGNLKTGQEASVKKTVHGKDIQEFKGKSGNKHKTEKADNSGILNLSGPGAGIFIERVSKGGKLKSNFKGKSSHSRKVVKKGRNKKLNKSNIQVVDLRRMEAKQGNIQMENSLKNSDFHKESDGSSSDIKIIEMDTSQLSRDMGTGNIVGITENKSHLLKELKDNINEKIVESSKIILKNKGKGEIRLILKPESLGKVRIRLHLEDHMLSGKIFVDNQEAMDALKQNMQHLERSFADKGFTMASLDVSVGGRENNSKGKSGKNIVSRSIINAIEDSVPKVGSSLYLENLVDLVV